MNHSVLLFSPEPEITQRQESPRIYFPCYIIRSCCNVPSFSVLTVLIYNTYSIYNLFGSICSSTVFIIEIYLCSITFPENP